MFTITFSRSPLLLTSLVLLASFQGCSQNSAPSQSSRVLIDNPYSDGGAWYRGNFHMHSAHSDGGDFARERVAAYSSGDIFGAYDVLAITDHDQYGDQDGGILDGRPSNHWGDKDQFVLPRFQVDDDSLHDWNGDTQTFPEFAWASGAEAYVRDYELARPSWMVDRWFRGDGTVPTPPILISGFEGSYGAVFSSHFVFLGFPPGPIVTTVRGHFDRQRLEEDIDFLRHSDALGFVFIAHPRANNQVELFASVLPLDLFDGIEIVNGLRLSMGAWILDPDPFATPLWDALLSSGHSLWGLANDDAHSPPGGCDAPPFTAFNMICTSDPTRDGFLQALRRGSFYASTGLFFDELDVQDATITAVVPGATLLRFVGRNGEVLAVIQADRGLSRAQSLGADPAQPLRLEYEATGNEQYVRIEAFGELVAEPDTCHNPDETGHDTWGAWPKALWSQPFFIHAPGSPRPTDAR